MLYSREHGMSFLLLDLGPRAIGRRRAEIRACVPIYDILCLLSVMLGFSSSDRVFLTD
jgi:hypothetical protein